MPLPPRIPSPPLSILLVSDFFLPHLGGVETHIYSLSQLLAAAGHAVTIVTKSLGGRCGVRCLPNSVKAYYAPFTELTAGTTVPTFTISYLYIRTILNREAINLVHTHQSTSVLANECCFYASILDIPVVHTDHSLFALGDLAGLHLSAAQSLVVDKAVQKNVVVSAVTGANVAARLGLGLERIAVIPNAVDSVIFHPLPESLTTLTRQTPSTITIAIISRLCYRKGTDILYNLIPLICSKHANVQVVIAGSGNKELLLNEMIERHDLADRVTLLGGLDTTAVVRTLQGADVMVNTSLTESFCIAILEAACAGNVVVSSDVGGVRGKQRYRNHSSIHPQCTLNTPSIHPQYTLNTPLMKPQYTPLYTPPLFTPAKCHLTHHPLCRVTTTLPTRARGVCQYHSGEGDRSHLRASERRGYGGRGVRGHCQSDVDASEWHRRRDQAAVVERPGRNLHLGERGQRHHRGLLRGDPRRLSAREGTRRLHLEVVRGKNPDRRLGCSYLRRWRLRVDHVCQQVRERRGGQLERQGAAKKSSPN